MSVFNDLIHKANRHQLATAVVLAMYIISGIDTPHELAKYINTTFGHIFIIIIALAFFIHTNLILGIIILIAGYEVIRRSSIASCKQTSKKYLKLPIIENFSGGNSRVDSDDIIVKDERTRNMKKLQPPAADHLEVDIISNMIPLTHNKQVGVLPWKPIQSCNNDVSPV